MNTIFSHPSPATCGLIGVWVVVLVTCAVLEWCYDPRRKNAGDSKTYGEDKNRNLHL